MNTDKTSSENTNKALHIDDVMPRFSESEIDKRAFDWSSERSIGDAEQDSQCMYDYAQGMRAMQKLLLPLRNVVGQSEQLVCERCNQLNDNDCSICYDCTEELQGLP